MPESDERPLGAVRSAVLNTAAEAVNGARDEQYGTPENNFQHIALFWQVYLSRRFGVTLPLQPSDVANLMVLLKISRLGNQLGQIDSYVDIAGYAAAGAECAVESGLAEVTITTEEVPDGDQG